MMRHAFRWMLLLLCVGWLLSAAHGLDRKGRLIRESRQPMTLRHGKVEPLPAEFVLTIDRDVSRNEDEPERVRLELRRTPAADQDRGAPRYLAYPAALQPDSTQPESSQPGAAEPRAKVPDEKPQQRQARDAVEVQLVDKPNDECLWKLVHRAGKTRYLSLLEVEAIQAPRGPYAGWELRIKEGRLLLAKPGSDAYQKSEWVGPYREYDNLDDGK